MVRSPYVDKNGLKKGAWSEEEDNKLRAYVLRYGHWNWRQLPKFAGLSRCGKSCRLRWMNYLKPGVKRGNYTVEEEDLIIKLHKQFGKKWSAIAGNLPGRTDNEIKNYWHTHLQKRTNQDRRSTEVKIVDQIKQSAAMSIYDSNQEMEPNTADGSVSDTEISSSSSDSPHFLDSNVLVESFIEPFESFWTQPFALDTSYDNNAHRLPPWEEEFAYPFSPFGRDDTVWFYEQILLPLYAEEYCQC